jgi:hypothetical protein
LKVSPQGIPRNLGKASISLVNTISLANMGELEIKIGVNEWLEPLKNRIAKNRRPWARKTSPMNKFELKLVLQEAIDGDLFDDVSCPSVVSIRSQVLENQVQLAYKIV